MRSYFTTSSNARPAWPLRAHAAVAVTVLLTSAAAFAAPLPAPPQQLNVAFTNAYPNGSINSLTMPNSAAIAATNPLYTGGTTQNIYTALTWVTNPATNTLDLIYADAEQHQIWRLPGPSYQSPTLIFSWSGKGSGPPYPIGLAADAAGNVYVTSPSCAWDNSGVWVLPFTGTGTGWGTPQLIDDTFKDPVTLKPIKTLALTEVLVASAPATPAAAAAPAWASGDLLVLVVDISSTRVIRYSQAQIQSVLTTQSAVTGPASTVVTQAQFSTQSVAKIAPVAIGMDIQQDPNTQDATLLFSTIGGRILDFDSAKNKFITPYAINLGLGLTRLKVGTFQGMPYVFVGRLPGAILEFAAPPPGTSNTTPFASVSTGVNNPSDLAVSNSGYTLAGSCVSPNTCNILPELSMQIAGPGSVNIPKNGSIVVDSCHLADPRSTVNDGVWSCLNPDYINICSEGDQGNCVPTTLDLGKYCTNMPHVFLQPNMCGKSGPSGTELTVTKLTPSPGVLQNVNNTLTTFIVNPNVSVPGNSNPNCGDANGPIIPWGPIPGKESNIPTGLGLIDITVSCVVNPDPAPGGKGGHPSIVVEGASVVGLSPATCGSGYINECGYIDGEFGDLQSAFTQLITAQPPQIVDKTNIGVVPAIQAYITQSQTYYDQQTPTGYNCALNTLWTGVQYVNALVNNPATAGDFINGAPPVADQNASGTPLYWFDHLYYDVNVWASNPFISTDALNLPGASVPACASAPPPAISGFSIVDGSGNTPTSDEIGFHLNSGATYNLVWTTNGAPACTLTTTDGLFTNAPVPLNSVFGSSPTSFTDTDAINQMYYTATLTCPAAGTNGLTSSFQYTTVAPPAATISAIQVSQVASSYEPPNSDATYPNAYDLFQGGTYYLQWSTSGMPAGAACTLTTTDGAYTNAPVPLNSTFGSVAPPTTSFTDNIVENTAVVETGTVTCGTAAVSVSSPFYYLVYVIG